VKEAAPPEPAVASAADPELQRRTPAAIGGQEAVADRGEAPPPPSRRRSRDAAAADVTVLCEAMKAVTRLV
jgi:hypothetical protein